MTCILAVFLFACLQDSFYDKTPYTIMFGPDKCGTDSKVSSPLHLCACVRVCVPVPRDVLTRSVKLSYKKAVLWACKSLGALNYIYSTYVCI